MNEQQYLLGKLAEEAAEVAQIALKCQQFGLFEIMPGQNYTNVQRVYSELNDLNAVIGILNREFTFGYIPDEIMMQIKTKKVEKYMEKSRALGQLDALDNQCRQD